MPKTMQNPYDRNLSNTNSFRKAIDAMCAHCMGCSKGHREPSFIEEVRNCTASQCPLWHFRPYRQKAQERPNSGSISNASPDPVPQPKITEIVGSSSQEWPSRGGRDMTKRYFFELEVDILTPLEVEADTEQEARRLIQERSSEVEYFDDSLGERRLMLVQCIEK